jgi:hypothetical protein
MKLSSRVCLSTQECAITLEMVFAQPTRYIWSSSIISIENSLKLSLSLHCYQTELEATVVPISHMTIAKPANQECHLCSNIIKRMKSCGHSSSLTNTTIFSFDHIKRMWSTTSHDHSKREKKGCHPTSRSAAAGAVNCRRLTGASTSIASSSSSSPAAAIDETKSPGGQVMGCECRCRCSVWVQVWVWVVATSWGVSVGVSVGAGVGVSVGGCGCGVVWERGNNDVMGCECRCECVCVCVQVWV